MTKLEQEIKDAIDFRTNMSAYNEPEPDDRIVKAAAEVAKKYIERAFDAGGKACFFNGYPGHSDAPQKEQWLKENGIAAALTSDLEARLQRYQKPIYPQ